MDSSRLDRQPFESDWEGFQMRDIPGFDLDDQRYDRPEPAGGQHRHLSIVAVLLVMCGVAIFALRNVSPETQVMLAGEGLLYSSLGQ